MIAQTIFPKSQLSQCVKRILVMDEPLEQELVSLPFYADGCPGIMYQQGRHPMFINSPDRISASLFLYGQTVKPVTFMARGPYRIVVFIFYPAAIKSLFGISSNELTDTCLDLEHLVTSAGAGFTDRLRHLATVNEQVTALSALVGSLLRSRPLQTDTAIDAALAQILASNGTALIKNIRSQVHLSERTLERRFEQYVGVSPKLFSRIIQFQASFNQVGSGNYDLLYDVAFEQGYSDQSHFIRSFREFTGRSPLELRQ